MRHKLGYGKPAGLGSVELGLTRLELIDHRERYASAFQGGWQVYTGDGLAQLLDEQTQRYTQDHSSMTLQDLRRIWKWPGRNDLKYPSWDWFREPGHGQLPLSETP